MAALVVRQRGQGLWRNAVAMSTRQMSSGAKKIDLESDVSLQEARSWDEGVSSKFSTTSVSELFKVIDRSVTLGLFFLVSPRRGRQW